MTFHHSPVFEVFPNKYSSYATLIFIVNTRKEIQADIRKNSVHRHESCIEENCLKIAQILDHWESIGNIFYGNP